MLFRSWKSLKNVRRQHFLASESAGADRLGYITQFFLVNTQFGFMGYALIRPELLGVKHNNDEDREGFVHFWAVIGYMLGIKNQFNMCLHPLADVEE